MGFPYTGLVTSVRQTGPGGILLGSTTNILAQEGSVRTCVQIQVVYGLVCKFRGHGMRDISQPHVLWRDHTMTVKKHSTNAIDLKALVAEDCDWMKSLIKAAVQEVLEAEIELPVE